MKNKVLSRNDLRKYGYRLTLNVKSFVFLDMIVNLYNQLILKTYNNYKKLSLTLNCFYFNYYCYYCIDNIILDCFTKLLIIGNSHNSATAALYKV